MGAPTDQPSLLTAEELHEPLQRLLGREGALTDWHVDPLRTSVTLATQTYRVRGHWQERSGTIGWSMVLKVLRAGTEALREVQAYRSGLLDSPHAGLAMPRCLDVAECDDGSKHLWLTDVGDDSYGVWPLQRYAVAARHLGLWSGTHAAEVLADVPWLAHHWLRDWIAASAPALEELPRLLGHPLVRIAYPEPAARRVLALWDAHERLVTATEALPQVLSHHDAHRANLITRDRSGARARTFLVDWQYIGVAGVGLEAAPLLGSALTEILVPPGEAHRLERLIYAGYLDGLRQAGWHGPDWAARLGFTATAGLRYTLGTARFLLPALVNPDEGRRLEAALGRPLPTIAGAIAQLTPFFLSLADEAMHLAKRIA